jgi:DNA repair protein RecO (recombination protein O)
MEELKVTAIVLSQADLKENDKLVTLFTLELGVIKAQLRGVKQAKSKLKFACQPFFVGEYFLIKRNNFYQVKTVNAIESFFDLTSDFDRYLIASIMLETIKLTFKDGMINEGVFLELLKGLNTLCYSQINEKMILTKYLINFLKFNGFELNFTTCANCGIKLTNNCHLSLTVGGFVCEVCNDNYDVVLEKNVFSSLKIISNTDIEKLSTVKLNNNIIIKCLLVLKLIFNNNFKVKLNSINNLLI